MLDGNGQIPEEEQAKEAIKFNLEQATKRFVNSLQSATSEDQVRQAIESLHGVFSDAMADDPATTMYMPMFIDALQNLKNIPKELQQTVDMMDYDLVTTVLDGLSDEFIENEDKIEKDEDKPSIQWANSIDQIFEELGVFK